MSESLQDLHNSVRGSYDNGVGDDGVMTYDSIEHGIVPMEEMKAIDEQVDATNSLLIFFFFFSFYK